jgi:hypothetical protein
MLSVTAILNRLLDLSGKQHQVHVTKGGTSHSEIFLKFLIRWYGIDRQCIALVHLYLPREIRQIKEQRLWPTFTTQRDMPMSEGYYLLRRDNVQFGKQTAIKEDFGLPGYDNAFLGNRKQVQVGKVSRSEKQRCRQR